jgi:hypothetical protein
MNCSIPPSRKHLLATLLAAAMAFGVAGCDDTSPPVASAGTAQSVTTGTTVTLDGSGSTDADADVLTYSWSIVSRPAGSTAAITGATTVKPTFTPDQPGAYVAKVVVSDGSSTSEATVTLTAADVLGFNAIPEPFPANYSSYSLRAYSIKAIGDHVTLKAGSPHTLATFSVGLSSYACQSGTYNSGCASAAGATFTAPITINLYTAAGVLLGSKTQVVTMPYRPAVDPTCPIPANFQYRAADGNCYTGVAFKATVDLRSLKLAVPDSFVYDVAYNTQASGYAPTGVPGPIDSVNVGVLDAPPNAPLTGSDPKPSLIRWDAADDTDLTDLYIVPAQIIMQAP